MPVQRSGDYSVEHPPLFRCKAHKKVLTFSPAFCEELVSFAESRISGSLTEALKRHLGGRAAYRLPPHLSSPKVVHFNPDGLSGIDALPFMIARVDRYFFAIPATYLDTANFRGCPPCAELPLSGPPPRQAPILEAGAVPPKRGPGPGSSGAAGAAKATGSRLRRPTSPGGGGKPGAGPGATPGKALRRPRPSDRLPRAGAKLQPEASASGRRPEKPGSGSSRRPGRPPSGKGGKPPPKGIPKSGA